MPTDYLDKVLMTDTTADYQRALQRVNPALADELRERQRALAAKRRPPSGKVLSSRRRRNAPRRLVGR